jgi:hypothetical protein
MSELLTPERRVHDVTLVRFLTTDFSLPLAEISTAGSPVALAPLDGVLDPPAPPAEIFFIRISLQGVLLSF